MRAKYGLEAFATLRHGATVVNRQRLFETSLDLSGTE
jgi:hypothetical protein